MGKVADDLIKMIETRKNLEELKKLKEKCFKVFSNSAGMSLDKIKKIVDNDWPILYEKCKQPAYNDVDIEVEAIRLTNGIINRKEFKEKLEETINIIEEDLERREKEAQIAERIFNEHYDSYFKNSNISISAVFMIPDVKDVIIKFMIS